MQDRGRRERLKQERARHDERKRETVESFRRQNEEGSAPRSGIRAKMSGEGMINERSRRISEAIQATGRGIRKSIMIRDPVKELAALRKNIQHTPRWMTIISKAYHRYGGKHIMLIAVLVLYAVLGGAMFYFMEKKGAESRETQWHVELERNRSITIERLLPRLFNDSHLLLWLDGYQTAFVDRELHRTLLEYEHDLGVRYTEQKIEWDFWNSMLYAGTVVTTIGYGHLFPQTTAGRVATMIYALFGIPLVLSILDDMGKLLTVFLKYPWMLVKMFIRRLFRHCTHQTMDQIKQLDQLDRDGLDVFDLPIPVALGVVILWIFICSATFCIWEDEWNYFLAFYFFFISLSTIGLGDITPKRPKMMLMMFFYIIIGLSLVSMCVNLIQLKLERTYERGAEPAEEKERKLLASQDNLKKRRDLLRERAERRSSATLGIFRRSSSFISSAAISRSSSSASYRDTNHLIVPEHGVINASGKVTRITQTVLSVGTPEATDSGPNNELLPASTSMDDVMNLVGAEQTDFVMLSRMTEGLEAKGLESLREVSAPFDALTPIDEEISPPSPATARVVAAHILSSSSSGLHGCDDVYTPDAPIHYRPQLSGRMVKIHAPVRHMVFLAHHDSDEESQSLIENDNCEPKAMRSA